MKTLIMLMLIFCTGLVSAKDTDSSCWRLSPREKLVAEVSPKMSFDALKWYVNDTFTEASSSGLFKGSSIKLTMADDGKTKLLGVHIAGDYGRKGSESYIHKIEVYGQSGMIGQWDATHGTAVVTGLLFRGAVSAEFIDLMAATPIVKIRIGENLIEHNLSFSTNGLKEIIPELKYPSTNYPLVNISNR